MALNLSWLFYCPCLQRFYLGVSLMELFWCFNGGLNVIWKYGSGFFILWSRKTSCGVQCDFRLFFYSQWIRFAELRECLSIDNPFHKSQQSSCSLRTPQSLEAFWRKREGRCWRFCFCFCFKTQKVCNNVYWDSYVKRCTPFCLGTGSVLIFFSSINFFNLKKGGGGWKAKQILFFFFTLVLKIFYLTNLSANL